MRNISTLVAVLVLLVSDQSAWAGIGTTPVLNFESHGNVGFDDLTGSGWWNMWEYEHTGILDVGAVSSNRIVGIDSHITVYKDDPSRFTFQASIKSLNNSPASGDMNFTQSLSSGEMSSWLGLHDEPVIISWDYVTGQPVYALNEWNTNFHFNLNLPAKFNSVDASYGHWTEESINDLGETVFSRSGGQFNVSGYGTFNGNDPAAFGRALVAAKMAAYQNSVPEPASASLLVLSGAALAFRRRQR